MNENFLDPIIGYQAVKSKMVGFKSDLYQNQKDLDILLYLCKSAQNFRLEKIRFEQRIS